MGQLVYNAQHETRSLFDRYACGRRRFITQRLLLEKGRIHNYVTYRVDGVDVAQETERKYLAAA